MPQTPVIHILARDSNLRGDLFARLMADLFVALGYGQPRLNIHKSGRELDLEADHRLESRRAIAECKATARPVGGDDVNKFVGALDAEYDSERPVIGYFISLSGFRETAVEQEKKRRRTRIVTLTGPQVIEELVRGRILVPKERATELAGRCCAREHELVLDPEPILLAHDRGWIWVVYYNERKARTHFVLIHADGTLLAKKLADEVIATDKVSARCLRGLSCLNPRPSTHDSDGEVAEALDAYRRYLADECGYILLDGMPADGDIGSRQLRLENLFIPLHLDISVRKDGEQTEVKREFVGAVLGEHSRLALLAAPGGGKSTLVKRLAVAYADPSRRTQICDELPKRDWLPLFFRCRELRGLARGSFSDLIDALCQREHVRQHAETFRAHLERELLAGRVLLLVDGLDEISDTGDRAAFVCTLRTTLRAYPNIAIVATSREAGFRHVAAHLAPVCTSAMVSAFDADDIRRLSVAWHREVINDSEKVRADAENFAETIAKSDRIMLLAVNPLLLTTLLLVKRWVGRLPTRRAVLYGKAVEVLLMTWNVEGHYPIPEEEAIPQLCYVAATMMLNGIQKISRPRLVATLQEARRNLTTELGYVQGTVEDFIHRVEDRSSLLMMTGYDVEDGQLVEFFEFRHLTFQEFLTARAMVEGWFPGRKDNDTLASVLESHFEDEKWSEVIPLAAVLGRTATESLIERLTSHLRRLSEHGNGLTDVGDQTGDHRVKGRSLCLTLRTCLADEAAAPPTTIVSAIRELVRHGSLLISAPHNSVLPRGKYGEVLREEARRAFLESSSDSDNLGDALLLAVWWQTVKDESYVGYAEVASKFACMLREGTRESRCEGALGCGYLCYQLDSGVLRADRADIATHLNDAGRFLLQMLFTEDLAQQCASAYALGGLGAYRLWSPSASTTVIGRCLELWLNDTNKTLARLGGRALTTFPIIPRQDIIAQQLISNEKLVTLFDMYNELDDRIEKPATLVIAYYTRSPLSDPQIIERVRTLLKEYSDLRFYRPRRVLNDILEALVIEPDLSERSRQLGRRRRLRSEPKKVKRSE